VKKDSSGGWFLEGTRRCQYAEGFLESPKDDRPTVEGSNSDPDENDPMFDDAVRLVFEFGKASLRCYSVACGSATGAQPT